ncbi:GAF domain-containing protein, partial [bacterium]|nr:GAF domain-containing protein [bacterium]
MAEKEKVVSLFGLPLASAERAFGVLRVYSTAVYNFSEDEINYLKVLANQTSIAIQNAHQIERLHRLSLVTNAMNKSLSK